MYEGQVVIVAADIGCKTCEPSENHHIVGDVVRIDGGRYGMYWHAEADPGQGFGCAVVSGLGYGDIARFVDGGKEAVETGAPIVANGFLGAQAWEVGESFAKGWASATANAG